MITTRRASIADLEPMLAIESAAIKVGYLARVYQDFFADEQGEMTVAVEDGEILGFGKLTIQYDGSGWAELLRVHPKSQGKGAGKAIWARYMEQCKEKNVPYLRMYTGLSNVVSKHLAEVNGLDKAYEYSEGSYPISGKEADFGGFFPVEYTPEVLDLVEKSWGAYCCFNRTFYHIGEEFLRAMAAQGKLYSDGVNVMALGSRFMPERGIHIGFMTGNPDKCLAFAKSEGRKIGAPCVITMHRGNDNQLHETLEKSGFVYLPANLYMLEGKL